MVFAQITAEDVDFEATLNRLFPKIYYRLITTDSRNLLIRLLQKMGEGALPACQVILKRLSQEDPHKIFAYLMNENAQALREMANEALSAHPLGKYGSVGKVRAGCRNGRLIFQAEEVQIDYKGLLAEPAVQAKVNQKLGNLGGFAQVAARAAMSASPETMEKKGIELLATEENCRKALGFLEPQLQARGVQIKLSDLTLSQGTAPRLGDGKLDPMTEEHILNAAADFLKEALKGR